MREVLREPLLHFAVVGAALFVLFDIAGQQPQHAQSAVASAGTDMSIIIDDSTVDRLAAEFRGVWNRAPSPDEIARLIDGFITEEILVREALALGLDVDDAVVRQRLRQKMEFLLEAAAVSETPSEAELHAFLVENPDRFAELPRLAFTQVFLGESAGAGDVEMTLAALGDGADPASLGQRSLLPMRVPPAPPQAVDGTFGRGVFDTLAKLPLSDWSGPVNSGYGQHVVRVDSLRPRRVPPLDEIRDEVAQALLAARAEQAKAARLDELRQIYDIQRELAPSEPAQ